MATANRRLGDVPIRLDRTRTLRMCFQALEAMERELGAEWSAMVNHSSVSIRHLVVMLWAALLHEDPQLELKSVSALVDEAEGDTPAEKIQYVFSRVQEAWEASGFKEKKQEAETPPAPEG